MEYRNFKPFGNISALSLGGGGSAYRLPNGNTHITSGQNEHLFEVTSKGEVVREYISPASSFGALSRPLAYPFQMNQTSYRISFDHPALRNRDLTPQGTMLELEPAASMGGQVIAFLLRHIQSGVLGSLSAVLIFIWFWRIWRRRTS